MPLSGSPFSGLNSKPGYNNTGNHSIVLLECMSSIPICNGQWETFVSGIRLERSLVLLEHTQRCSALSVRRHNELAHHHLALRSSICLYFNGFRTFSPPCTVTTFPETSIQVCCSNGDHSIIFTGFPRQLCFRTSSITRYPDITTS
jgi:hypothetical protein